MSQHVDGPTPHGGAYATIYYLDDSEKAVSKENATKVRICEFDKNNKLIYTTYMRKNNNVQKNK